MPLTSPLFLSFFLPFAAAGVFLTQKTGFKNAWLLLCSCVFFAFSGVRFLPLAALLCVLTWLLPRFGRIGVRALVFLQLATLIFFKLLGGAWPLGLSFLTLQGVSYALDVQNGRCEQGGLLDVSLYLTFFPKISAGPLMRFQDFKTQKNAARPSTDDLEKGLTRLIIGLSKKVLLANRLYPLLQAGFAQRAHPLSCLMTLILCPLYVYYDFSGYTDMALGAAQILGLRLPENFNRPFSALSLRDFWRRWHISLSGFLRDYVYIPLGGSRLGKIRTVRNVLAVFLLMGLWHGLTLPYLLFGLWHGLFVSLEHLHVLTPEKWARIPARLYTLFVVAVGFVFFLAPDLSAAFSALRGLFCWTLDFSALQAALASCSPLSMLAALAAVLLPLFRIEPPASGARRLLYRVLLVLLLIAAYASMLAANYSPFLYAQF